MRVSTLLPFHDWRLCGPAAKTAEDDGYDCVQCSELKHDPFIPLAFAALATERVQLATSVAIAFPRSPMIVANLAFDLHRHSKGRYVVGLGTQVKPHNERRFSTPWIAPAARMVEYVESLRAIFRCWENGEKLNYQGQHYRFSLMTPEFSPPPTGLPMPPIAIAAVGPYMLKAAARHCDSVRLHGFATRKYLEEIVRPQLETELQAHGKRFENFEITGGGFVVTGPDEEAVAKAAEKIRYRVAFYGSTPAYRGVLELHGHGELGQKLQDATRRGEWSKMAAMVPDDVLDLFVARATYDNLPAAIEKRFGGLVDTVTLEFLPGDSTETRRRVIKAVQAIPSAFKGFKTALPR
jgi:probable F420-dependent oxidoreductase